MSNRGSLTIEASIGIFVIIILFAFTLTVMNELFINEVVNQGLYKTAIETSSLKGMNYTVYESNVSKGLMIGGINKSLKEAIKYDTFEKLKDSDLKIDYDYHSNRGDIALDYNFNLIGKSVQVKKSITFVSFLHKDISLRALEDNRVFVTNTGVKYHKDGCYYLRRSKREISLLEATKQEYTPCSKCYLIVH